MNELNNLNELDNQLRQLALLAQSYPPLTQGRQLALGQLVQAILKSNKLCRPQRGNFDQRYEEIYQVARQELLLYVCQNIDRYNPERAEVMAWCNFFLSKKFFPEAIQKVLAKPGIQIMPWPELDKFPLPEEPSGPADIIKYCIELDPDNLFQKTHIQDYPEANFQALSLQRLEGKTWKEISEKFGIKISTLSRFYDRCLKRFASNLQECYENHLT